MPSLMARRPGGMEDDEEAVYDLSVEIHRTKRVSDATYRKAVAKFGEQGLIEVLGINGYYAFLAMTLNATRTPLPPGVAETAEALPGLTEFKDATRFAVQWQPASEHSGGLVGGTWLFHLWVIEKLIYCPKNN